MAVGTGAGMAVGAAATVMAGGGLAIGIVAGDRVRAFLPQACWESPSAQAWLPPIMAHPQAIITGPAIGDIMTVAAAIGGGRQRLAIMSATPSAGSQGGRPAKD